MKSLNLLLLFFLCLYLGLPRSINAQSRTITAYKLGEGESVQLNGSLDESFWQKSTPASGFLQREPFEGADATEDTEVYVVYNDKMLYLGVMLKDSDPSGILGYQKQRDGSLFSDDRFMWILDTFKDGRNGYYFEINPAGLMGDGLLSTSSGVNDSWDGIWEARVDRGDYGWSAEVRIPFSTLNFNPENDTWGINFQRTIRRKQEETVWSGHERNQSMLDPIFAGELSGLQGMSQGTGLEVTPYGVTGWRYIPDNDDAVSYDADAGFDITYSFTSSLRGALSVNTDFAEVEVDQRRVNLTRFPLFFPEKRDFFLEGSAVFDFAPRNGAGAYFSRRIGLAGGQQIPITYGTRLAGQQGTFDLGFLHVRTAETNAQGAENFTVGRVKKNMGEQSSIGMIVTRRASNTLADETPLPDRYTLGSDLELTTRNFLGLDKNFNFQAFWVWHTENINDEGTTDLDRSVRGLRFRYDNEPWVFQTSYREFGDDYNPAVGFNFRNGYKRIEPQFTFDPRLPNSKIIRELGFRAAYETLWDLNNRVLTRGINTIPFSIQFESGDRVGLSFDLERDRLENDFEIFDGIVIPTDEYTFTEFGIWGFTTSRRRVSTFAQINTGQFWSGRQTEMDIRLTVKPVNGLSLTSAWERIYVDLQEGDFTTNVYSFTGGWQFSPWTALTNIVQYDDVSELLTVFMRFRWTIRPGNDVFIIFNRNWENRYQNLDPDKFMLRAFETGAAVKVNYAHRF